MITAMLVLAAWVLFICLMMLPIGFTIWFLCSLFEDGLERTVEKIINIYEDYKNLTGK